MTTAAPLVKPLITGRLKKLDKNPKRNTPQTNSTRPAINASCCDSTPYSALPTGASAPMAVPTISEVMAIGPTDCTMLLPNTA